MPVGTGVDRLGASTQRLSLLKWCAIPVSACQASLRIRSDPPNGHSISSWSMPCVSLVGGEIVLRDCGGIGRSQKMKTSEVQATEGPLAHIFRVIRILNFSVQSAHHFLAA